TIRDWAQLPMSDGAGMTEDGVGTTGQHRRHAPPRSAEAPMADGVDATVEGMKVVEVDEGPDRRRRVLQPGELPSRDNAVLPSGELRELPMTWTIQPSCSVDSIVQVRHGPQRRGKGAPCGCRTVPTLSINGDARVSKAPPARATRQPPRPKGDCAPSGR